MIRAPRPRSTTETVHHRWRAAALAVLVLLLGPGLSSDVRAADPVSPDEVEALDWGDTPNVTRVRHLYFAGQPDRAGLEAARAAGVGVVVNLRGDEEMAALGWDEAAAVEELGMRYVQVPVVGGFSTEAFDRVDAVVAEAGDEPVLVHCSSSNRAGAWLTRHLVDEHDMSLDDALVVGRRAGITKPQVEQGVRALVGSD